MIVKPYEPGSGSQGPPPAGRLGRRRADGALSEPGLPAKTRGFSCCTACVSRTAASQNRTARWGCARSTTWSFTAGECSSSRAKSVTDEVRIRSDGSGGDEWTRKIPGQRNRNALPTTAGAAAIRLPAGVPPRAQGRPARQACPWDCAPSPKSQREPISAGSSTAPIQLVVAVSDKGKIRRVGGWREPSEPFRSFVAKADQVVDKIAQEIQAHRKGASVASNPI